MDAPRSVTPLIRTKLHRPPIAGDILCRQALLDRLEQGVDLPLTLVSAPAGYGKSTLISHWLQSRDGPSAWLSLDETEDDLRQFVSHLVAAVQTVFPQACRETLGRLRADAPVSAAEITALLVNDLDTLEASLVLVLDDYHRINDQAVHELLGHLLEHKARPLHLVIVTRHDPPLPLAALRAHNFVNDIRLQDLRFNAPETADFLQKAAGFSLSDSVLERIHATIEGWPVGLRLAALALQRQADADTFLVDFKSELAPVHEYMVKEVLSLQPRDKREWLYKTSILDRFNAPLCASLCMAGDETDGRTFIHFLEDTGMLCIPLDGHRQWYRYHHLFQEILYQQLESECTDQELAGLHQRAADWLEAQGLLEEAIEHALKAGGPAAAASLIVRHRNDIMNKEQWYRLDQWLQQLPVEVIEGTPELLMLQAWHMQNRGRYPDAFALLDRVEALLDATPQESTSQEQLRGSIDALRSNQSYKEGQGELALQHTEQALQRLPADCLSERAYANIQRGGALQMLGQLEPARKVVYDLLSDDSVPPGTYQARMLVTLCFINWIAADLPALQRVARQCLELGEKLALDESAAIGHIFLGVCRYHRNELADAEAMLLPVSTIERAPNLEHLSEIVFALATVQQAQGRADKANATVRFLCDYLLRYRNTSLLLRAEAFEADLALRQGRIIEAMTWAQGFDPLPFIASATCYEPRLTLARVLVTEGSAQSLARAADLLTRLEAFFAGIHSTRLLIEVYALQALLADASGDEPAARDALGRALCLGQPGGFIRLFVDLGPGLARHFGALELDERQQPYVAQIIAALQADQMANAGGPFAQPITGTKASGGHESSPDGLTRRERQVLDLLTQRLSRKEIAEQLCISTATVKRHSENIFGKLGVADRHQAIAKARLLGI